MFADSHSKGLAVQNIFSFAHFNYVLQSLYLNYTRPSREKKFERIISSFLYVGVLCKNSGGTCPVPFFQTRNTEYKYAYIYKTVVQLSHRFQCVLGTLGCPLCSTCMINHCTIFLLFTFTPLMDLALYHPYPAVG